MIRGDSHGRAPRRRRRRRRRHPHRVAPRGSRAPRPHPQPVRRRAGGPAGRAGRGRRLRRRARSPRLTARRDGDLQRREPAVPPLAAGLAADLGGAAGGRGAGRRRPRHGVEPLRLRARRGTAHRGPATRRDRPKGRIRARDVARRARGAHRGPRTRHRGAPVQLPGPRLAEHGRRPRTPARRRRPAGLPAGRPGHSRTRSRTRWTSRARWSRWPRTSAAGAGPGTCRATRRRRSAAWSTRSATRWASRGCRWAGCRAGMLTAMGLAVPMLREFGEVRHQYERPWLVDDAAARATFGLEPLPWHEIVAELADTYRPAGRQGRPDGRPDAPELSRAATARSRRTPAAGSPRRQARVSASFSVLSVPVILVCRSGSGASSRHRRSGR